MNGKIKYVVACKYGYSMCMTLDEIANFIKEIKQYDNNEAYYIGHVSCLSNYELNYISKKIR